MDRGNWLANKHEVEIAALSIFAQKYPNRKTITLPDSAMGIDSLTWYGEHCDAAKVWWCSRIIVMKAFSDFEDCDKLKLIAARIVEGKRLSHGVLADFHVALAMLCEVGLGNETMRARVAETFDMENTPTLYEDLVKRATELWTLAYQFSCSAKRWFLARCCLCAVPDINACARVFYLEHDHLRLQCFHDGSLKFHDVICDCEL